MFPIPITWTVEKHLAIDTLAVFFVVVFFLFLFFLFFLLLLLIFSDFRPNTSKKICTTFMIIILNDP